MSSTSNKMKYCPSCGKTVPVYTMISGAGELERCQFCSSEVTEEKRRGSSVNMGRAYIVEDTTLLREMIKDIMLIQGLADDVVGCKNGAEFLNLYTQDLIRNNAPGLVMLDVVMPVMNGINAAVAMRAVENGFQRDHTPILFFTVRQCDESFKKVLRYCSPAMYINKGTDASPDKMHHRVEAVVSKLWKEMQGEL